MKRHVSGYEVEERQKRLASDPPPLVIMHKMGTRETGFLTPTEARELSRFLDEAADAAEAE